MTVIGPDFIFIHVPKAAGQSVTRRLGGMTRGVPGHAPLSWLTPDQRAGRFAFGFVRNPWDRMVSTYAFLGEKTVKRGEDPAYPARIRAMGFRRWLLEDRFFQPQDALWQAPGLEPIQSRSQMFWLEGCDFIGRVETLERDMALIEARITRPRGWRERLGLALAMPHRNRSSRAPYRDYYDDDTRAFVARAFAPEIARFGYRFDGAADQPGRSAE